MKRTQEDEPSKARRGWQRGRGRPPRNGEGSPAAARPKRASRSVFGPSGDERPDVLTDAETVVLPVWLHRRPSSAGGTTAGKAAPSRTAGNAAPPRKTTDVPAQPDETPGPEPGPGEAPASEALADGAAEAEADGGADAGAAGGPAAEAVSGAAAEAAPGTAAGAQPAPETDAGASPDAEVGTRAEPGAGAGVAPGAEDEPEGGTGADGEADDQARRVAEGPGPDTSTGPDAAHPDSETIITISLADLRAAARAAKTARTRADEAETIPAVAGTAGTATTTGDKTVELKTVEPTTVEPTTVGPETVEPKTAEAKTADAVDARPTTAIDGVEARTAETPQTVEVVEAIEVKTAEAMETIEAMTADALQAIDATAAQVEAAVTGEPGPADPAHREHDRAGPERTGNAGPSSGLSVTRPHVIRIDEPPPSVTLTTSATETTIALPHPRGESTVAVTPAPAAPVPALAAPGVTSTALAPDRSVPQKALPPAKPRTPAQAPPEPEPAYVTTRRRTRVSRFVLLAILALQAVLCLRLHNTAFEDEALYLYSGHMELEHLLHGAALQGQYASYFSGSPVLYPVAAGFLNGLGGITAARMLSLAEMLSITALLYSLTRRLFNERVGLCAALLFSVCESAIFLGNFATYDATCLFLLACAAWIMVRTAGFRWPVFLLAAPVAALAVGVKYAGLMFVPTIAVLPALAGWPLRGRRVLLYPPAFVAAVAGLLYGALHLGGHAYTTAISSTTTNRVQGLTPVATLLKESAEWGGVIFVLALIGTAAYVWRVRTEPEELIAPPGGRFRRLCLGVVLTGTALLAPAYQAHLHTDISFQKHIGFGLFFAAPMAALGLVRILGDHFRRPHIGVGIWSLALVLGIVQSGHLYQVWPNSTQFVRTFSHYLKPHARYLVEVPEVPIYYLLGHKDAQPRQFTSTFYINYVNSKGVLLSGTVGFAAAVKGGYFQVVAYNGDVTGAADAVLAQALSASPDYYLAAEIHITDVFGPGDYFIWVKGHPKKPRGLFHHASRKYPDLGTKLSELPP